MKNNIVMSWSFIVTLVLVLSQVGCEENRPFDDSQLDTSASVDTSDEDITGTYGNPDGDADTDFDSDGDANMDTGDAVIESDTYPDMDWYDEFCHNYEFEYEEMEMGLCWGPGSNWMPYTCDLYRCQFCQRLLYPGGGYYFPEMCHPSEWECNRCYFELYQCIWKEADACMPEPIMYKEMGRFRDCYLEVTGFDRCRWIMPDVCEGIPECTGGEWPPV